MLLMIRKIVYNNTEMPRVIDTMKNQLQTQILAQLVWVNSAVCYDGNTNGNLLEYSEGYDWVDASHIPTNL